MQATTYELKYCERCGTLLLRRSKSAESYCRPCGQILINYSLTRSAVIAASPEARSSGETGTPRAPAGLLQFEGNAQGSLALGRLP